MTSPRGSAIRTRTTPELVWSPADRQTLVGSGISKDELLITLLDNVRGKASALNFANGRWTSKPIALPANATISISGTDDRSNLAMFNVTDFLNPTSLYLYDGSSGHLEKIKSIPPRFDASKSEVVQHEAVSKDGTRIPYFVIQPKGMKADGSTPTLLNGYGGFQNPQLPYYSATLGRLWLEQGNAYVVANIRGGGEFGPAWHQAAIRETKQKTWDDFIAVAEDLIRRGISSPRRLGVVGGSQGGLLVGTAITQRPELFNAAIVQVPLFDMLRYHLIGAGQSWTGEYGDPRVPEERAWLDAYSPYQKLNAGVKLPDPFFITSTADDRVTPVHGRKAAARMKEIGAPYLYFENMEGGHAGAANNPGTRPEYYARIYLRDAAAGGLSANAQFSSMSGSRRPSPIVARADVGFAAGHRIGAIIGGVKALGRWLPRQADAAERRVRRRAVGRLVPVDHARRGRWPRSGRTSSGFRRQQARGEAEAGVVGLVDRGVEILDPDQLQHRAEQFLVGAVA